MPMTYIYWSTVLVLPNIVLLTLLFDEHTHLYAATNAHAFAQPCATQVILTLTTTPHVVATLKTLQSCTVFLCFNPHCVSRHNLFATEKVFTMHLQRLPLCLTFFCCDRTMILQSCEQKRVDATFADTVVTCTKRPKALRCEIVS